jgi:hypothetical protein
MASMGVRPARSMFMRGRGGPQTFGDRLIAKMPAGLHGEMPTPPPSKLPPDPLSVVNQIVQHLNTSYMAYPGEPFTSEERRTAFDKILEDIRNRLDHADWKPLCDTILAGVFGDPREAIHRSNLLAVLLSRLAGQLNEVGALRQRIMTHVSELRRASREATEALDRIEQVFVRDGLSQSAMAELLTGLQASRHLWCDKCIEDALAKITQVGQEIHEQLQTFLGSVARK